MTVKKMKELLEKYPDNYRIVLDNTGPYYPNMHATHQNEVMSAITFNIPKADIVMLQIRDDFDVHDEIEAMINHFKSLYWTDEEIAKELVAFGYDFDDYAFEGTLRDAMMKELAKEETKC